MMLEPGEKATVLAVDDTPENLDVVRGALEGRYVIKVAINGMLALKIAQKTSPDVILLDIRMPGMDGFEVMEQLQASEETRSIPVIFLSGESDSEVRQRARNLGAAAFVTKPIDRLMLQEVVAAALTD